MTIESARDFFATNPWIVALCAIITLGAVAGPPLWRLAKFLWSVANTSLRETLNKSRIARNIEAARCAQDPSYFFARIIALVGASVIASAVVLFQIVVVSIIVAGNLAAKASGADLVKIYLFVIIVTVASAITVVIRPMLLAHTVLKLRSGQYEVAENSRYTMTDIEDVDREARESDQAFDASIDQMTDRISSSPDTRPHAVATRLAQRDALRELQDIIARGEVNSLTPEQLKKLTSVRIDEEFLAAMAAAGKDDVLSGRRNISDGLPYVEFDPAEDDDENPATLIRRRALDPDYIKSHTVTARSIIEDTENLIGMGMSSEKAREEARRRAGLLS